MRILSIWLAAAGLCVASGCQHTRQGRTDSHVSFDPLLIRGDPELEKLTDEELFAAGTAAFAGADYTQAARYFGRIADFHPRSPHFRTAAFNAGLAHQKNKEWEDAYARFSLIADAERGTGDALDASFRAAETLYHLERFDTAVNILVLIAERKDIPLKRRLEAQVQKGICELEAGRVDTAEKTLRSALATYNDAADKSEVDDYFPAQAQFFLGEIFRQHYEAVVLDPAKGVDALAKDLEYKAELLLSAQGHYLRSIRIGNGYWATAAGAQIGGLYQDLYEHMAHAPAPKELTGEQVQIYQQEVRKKIRVLITKAIGIYERTLEAAERIGSVGPFIERTRESLKKMKELLVADLPGDDVITPPPAPPEETPEPHS
jgi:tetratricopeptide (TPR) repeat protein